MDQVEEVKQKTDIVNVVQERVKMSRAGRNFRALCPFHSERTPSFMVSPELQIYKCFGCAKGGDVFSFLKEFEGMEFPEALSYLAERAGVKLKPLRKDRDFIRKERLREINHITSEYFHYLLNEHEVGKQALRYLAGRGVRRRAIAAFKIGYAAANWDTLLRYLTSKKSYRIDELKAVGLVVARGGRYYDRFRNRVIFPLRDVRGNVIGFAGRVLPGEDESRAKYINSPATELYNKSEHLYGIYENKREIKRLDQTVVVEGELDMISSWLAGVKQVVAVKGTALTSEQLSLLHRYSRNLVLALDADMAGERATKSSIAKADAHGFNTQVALITGGKDPDEISQLDPKRWRKLVEKAVSVYDFYLSSMRKRYDLATGVGKKQASEELIPILATISNTIEQAHYSKKFSRLLDVSEMNVAEEISRYLRSEAVGSEIGPAVSEVTASEKPRSEILEEYLIALMLQGGKQVMGELKGDFVSVVNNPAIGRILTELLKREAKSFEVGEFIRGLPRELQDMAQQAYLRDLEFSNDEELLKKEIKRTVEDLTAIFLREQMKVLSGKIEEMEKRPGLSDGEEKELMKLSQEFDEISKKLKI